MLIDMATISKCAASRAKLAELIRLAVRNAQSENDEVTASELIAVLEVLDQQAQREVPAAIVDPQRILQ
jgi:hypothetical protein